MEALKFGKGELLKLHNDYSVFVDDSLQDMIDIARKYSKEKPEIFFSLKSLKNKDKIKEFSTFNDFLNDISYYSTWSSAFSIWKEDFDDLMNKNISYDNMFPHTSLLFNLVKKEKYVVDDSEYAKSVELKKKGGYNVVDNFVRIYLSMVRDDLYIKGFISKRTYNKIASQTILFVAKNYRHVKDYSDRFTFSYDGKERIIKKQCGIKGVILFYIGDIIYLPKSILIRILRILNLEQTAKKIKRAIFNK